MKKLNYIIFLCLSIILISSTLSYADIDKSLYLTNTHISKDNLRINNMYSIETKTLNEESSFFKSNIKYPYLKIKDKYSDKKNKSIKVIQDINNNIQSYITGNFSKVKEQSKQYEDYYNGLTSKEKENTIKYQFEIDTDSEVSYNKNNLISIPITTYEFTGGAHGMTYLTSFNYNLATGDEIKLKDIFKKDVDYVKIANKYISSQIAKDKDNFFYNDPGIKGFTTISSNQEFYITDDGIVIYFPLYSIAPYSTGIPKFKMTYKEFGKYLIDLDK